MHGPERLKCVCVLIDESFRLTLSRRLKNGNLQNKIKIFPTTFKSTEKIIK